MQVQRVQNNGYSASFGERLIFDKKIVSRATAEEKSQLAALKRSLRIFGSKGDIKIKNDNRITIKELIENLRNRFSHIDEEYLEVIK